MREDISGEDVERTKISVLGKTKERRFERCI